MYINEGRLVAVNADNGFYLAHLLGRAATANAAVVGINVQKEIIGPKTIRLINNDIRIL